MNALLQEFTSVNIIRRASAVFDKERVVVIVMNNCTMLGTQEIKFTTLINKTVLTPLSLTLRCPALFSPAKRGTAKAAMARACLVAIPMDIKFNVIPMYMGTVDRK